MVSKAKLAKLDLGAAFEAVNKTLEVEARDMVYADFENILSGQETKGYVFNGKAMSKTIVGVDVGIVLVRDVATSQEMWLGVADKRKDEIYSAKRLSALEWKIGLALKGSE